MLSSILGKSNLQFAGMSISLTISTASLNLRTPDSKQVCGGPGSVGPRVDILGASGSELTEPTPNLLGRALNLGRFDSPPTDGPVVLWNSALSGFCFVGVFVTYRNGSFCANVLLSAFFCGHAVLVLWVTL